MTIQDLRIGNYINRTTKAFKDKPLGVTQVDLDFFYWIVECVDDFDNYEPIQITEEWLVRMGFEHSTPYGNNGFYYNNIISLGYDCEEPFVGQELFVWSTKERVPYPTIIASVTYINQLQNLYHALTGQELIIKPI